MQNFMMENFDKMEYLTQINNELDQPYMHTISCWRKIMNGKIFDQYFPCQHYMVYFYLTAIVCSYTYGVSTLCADYDS